jgi:PhzF family phenazine biosynthesis protein
MKTFIVDAFTNVAFKGNPAGVCVLDKPISDEKMFLIAKELNLSETAFVIKLEESNTFSIRYFSPKMEMDLCGHATLASSKVIFENYDLDKIHFITHQNLDLLIKKSEDQIIMEFPVYEVEPAIVPQALLTALGISEILNCVYNTEYKILVIEIESAKKLAALTPDYTTLIHSHTGINGVSVTALSDKDNFDFESRYFWPWSGSNEDPVTGGTHTFLTKYWGKKLNKKKMNSFQSSERTGFMEVELISETKLLIKSSAVIVFEGKSDVL